MGKIKTRDKTKEKHLTEIQYSLRAFFSPSFFAHLQSFRFGLCLPAMWSQLDLKFLCRVCVSIEMNFRYSISVNLGAPFVGRWRWWRRWWWKCVCVWVAELKRSGKVAKTLSEQFNARYPLIREWASASESERRDGIRMWMNWCYVYLSISRSTT